MPAVLSEQRKRPDIRSAVAVYPAVVCVLYPSGCGGGDGACAGNADASEDDLLHPDDRIFPEITERRGRGREK